MFGIITAIISGVAMSIQGVLNTRLGEKIGIWETTVVVQGTALILSLIISIFYGKGSYRDLLHINKVYLLGGFIGVIITFTVMKSIGLMGPTLAISIILISQLIAAALIDAFGLFGSKRLSFSFHHFIGIAIMIIGIVIFKWKH